MRVMLLNVLAKEENNGSPPDWATLVINRDKIVVGNEGIILKPAKAPKMIGNIPYQPRRPRTAIERFVFIYHFLFHSHMLTMYY
jgi:hypothetical protein